MRAWGLSAVMGVTMIAAVGGASAGDADVTVRLFHDLPKSVVADLVKHHVVTLKSVIDAQATKDPVKAYAALRTAAAHMSMIADPLAEAIVKQFPDKFAAR